MMGCPRMYHCCLCCSVRSGSLTLGIAGIVFDLIGVITLSSGLGGALYIFENPEKTLNDPGITDAQRQDIAGNKQVFYAILATMLAITVLHLICCCLLVHGVNKDNKNLLVPWILWTFISGVFHVIVFIVQVSSGQMNTPVGIVLSICGIIMILYFTWCVYSHYANLRDGDTGPSGKVGPN